jgi:hypothetical protein
MKIEEKKTYIKIQFKPICSSLDSLATTFEMQQHAWSGSTTVGFTREHEEGHDFQPEEEANVEGRSRADVDVSISAHRDKLGCKHRETDVCT